MNHDRINKEKFFRITIISYFFVFIMLASFSKLAGEDDLFWYLSTGRYIVQNSAVPSFDVFGFTTSGMPWIPFEWCWDVMIFLIYPKGGFLALSILASLIIALLFYMLWKLLAKFKINYSSAAFYLILLSAGIAMRLTVKPHLISYFSIVLILTIIVRYRYFERDNYKILYFLPFIFFLWMNFHMGVLTGVLALGIFVFSEAAGFIFRKKFTASSIRPLGPKELIRVMIISIISILATLINPHGFKTYEFAFHLVSLNQLNVIYEWVSPFSGAYLTSASNIIYYLFILGLVPVIYYSYKMRDVFPALLCSGFFIHSLRAYRFTADYTIISVLFIAVSLKYLTASKFNSKFFIALKTSFIPKLLYSIFLLLLIIAIPGNHFYTFLGYPKKFGYGIESNNFPVKMFKFIKNNDVIAKIERPFNTYEFGGYFVWNFPQKKNFIGSRTIDDGVWNQYTSIINLLPGYKNIIDSLNFDCFIWMVPFINYSRSPSLLDYGILSYLFRESGGWKLVYWDDVSFLFVKNSPAFDQLVMRYEYKYVTPFNFYFNKTQIEKGFEEEKSTVLREFERKQMEDPSGLFNSKIRKTYQNKLGE